ncbi:MAG: hypothetical protein DWQ05_19665 [Calditrichaeota bacterium]|nr:MAG: hypothetical protein DWQ05_19665 [Calditrichota bacterium]
MNKNLKLTKTALILVLFFSISCGGSKSLQNSPDIDVSWQGIWSGPALIENSTTPAKIFSLEIVFTSTHITGYFTDKKAGINRKIVHDLQLKDGELHFKVPYQTKFVMRSFMSFTGKRNGRNMAVTFIGRESGRSFKGKWQARNKRVQ